MLADILRITIVSYSQRQSSYMMKHTSPQHKFYNVQFLNTIFLFLSKLAENLTP